MVASGSSRTGRFAGERRALEAKKAARLKRLREREGPSGLVAFVLQ